MDTRLTISMVSTLMEPEKARKEFEYTKGNVVNSEEVSSVRTTLEEWNGREWVVKDSFQHEFR